MQKKINKSLAGIILASGDSKRMKSAIPKQYLSIDNKSLLEINIEKFLSLSFLSVLVVVVNKNHTNYYNEIKNKYKNIFFIQGGKSRQYSAYNALKFLQKLSIEYVMIHDSARPYVSEKLIVNLFKKIIKYKTAVVPVIKIRDSIKLCNKNIIIENINREKLYLSQTPQFFNYKLLFEIYLHNVKKLNIFTDDAQIFSRSNYNIYTIPGESENIKITTKKEWNKNKMLKNNFIVKVGQGFDTHKLVRGKSITLFGIKIPHKYSLHGHSDADVGVHAIIDALLGSCSLGDIGKHFPNTEKKYKDINSLVMLNKTYEILKNYKSYISHIDCTLVGETPKISKYTDKMSLKIAKTLKLKKENVSIKATTTEGLGFTGRQEGISCYCVATIKQES
ncbi:MAG: 2-C-methyl-D-erythritol 2,4-cyclodiphosphate synthase [Pelagibacterales bacterium]|nr:2-C-methyl-D-erythritol 2,4-cyclodiphosphate synthase [Pelagibacterales bacterium]OUU61277.1 MAG: 2-C-methyl-D-erythritol 2,4-cyclodiphosphate synthase [Alphaproteobacteria bacterium TMED62]|tara:strand:- start:6175 stop:7347 length:1173 start_codon:yes stop_codon:yes gene_type:complete